jgi:MFS-type transporter involved in bile tolerance (Atg22 family)
LMMVLAASAVGGVLGAMIIGYVRRRQPSQPTLLG